jgi:thiol-disulfide isomerase/thioredoxin
VIAPLLVLALLVFLPAGLASAGPEQLSPLLKALDLRGYSPGMTPPNFGGETFDARRVALADLRGKVVIVNFWASWCVECRPEMPVLERLYRQNGAQGLAVIGVNARENADAVRRYAQSLGLTYPLVLDRAGTINTLYGVVGLPSTFLIARDGRAVAFAVGPREWGGTSARTIIDTLLGEPAPRPVAP